MTQQTYNTNNYDTFIGLDVDKKSFSFNIQDHSKNCKSKKMPSNPEPLYNYINKHYNPEKVICAY